ncbi:hypothetical protein [Glycomyces tritici]|uniref:ABM domain-containing protein n=1 Tax=Glycomyces tritici TaxID=2665176 RepID=A0ABT7YWZ5_9ACTN|nr:hypothetical protein [Glycomyces tritici]MDN3243143.1 hypothetical protein [Glycomyces tritici]
MSAITVTRFTVDPADIDALRAEHTALATAVKGAGIGLEDAWLGRVSETEWAGVWRWDSLASLRAARETPPAPELARAALALVESPTVDEIEVFDEH